MEDVADFCVINLKISQILAGFLQYKSKNRDKIYAISKIVNSYIALSIWRILKATQGYSNIFPIY